MRAAHGPEAYKWLHARSAQTNAAMPKWAPNECHTPFSFGISTRATTQACPNEKWCVKTCKTWLPTKKRAAPGPSFGAIFGNAPGPSFGTIFSNAPVSPLPPPPLFFSSCLAGNDACGASPGPNPWRATAGGRLPGLWPWYTRSCFSRSLSLSLFLSLSLSLSLSVSLCLSV